ncbi:NAD(P)-dependent alcohol dehydrogenase [Sphaerisporangium aureirubrum]|uniref:NAD(P)-dependent alcohol dehydrogenase n=1 Tax=Sphaerisporangium aureirubrum TaxID=1544736 RepID=A0ABW1NI85_9ACTN
MKAVTYYSYGSPDVLRIEDVETPVPGDKDLLIRIGAAVVTATDVTFRAGDPFYSRLATGPTRPRARTLGAEVAGEVAAIGKDVTRFAVGDRVLAVTGPAFGGHAEYVRVPEDGAVAPAPSGLSHGEAAAVCDGVLTALPFLRDHARLHQGQDILVNGASGGVGLAAVRLAKHFGARVTGVCGAAKTELVRSAGADDVVDYTARDFTREGRTYDVVFDAAGKSSFARCKQVLNDGGVYLTTAPSASVLLRTLWKPRPGRKRAVVAFTGLRSAPDKAADLRFLTELAEAGHIRPVIDGFYPLARAAEAHRRVGNGHKQGSVVLVMDEDGD